jgi:hypothetical protein
MFLIYNLENVLKKLLNFNLNDIKLSFFFNSISVHFILFNNCKMLNNYIVYYDIHKIFIYALLFIIK